MALFTLATLPSHSHPHIDGKSEICCTQIWPKPPVFVRRILIRCPRGQEPVNRDPGHFFFLLLYQNQECKNAFTQEFPLTLKSRRITFISLKRSMKSFSIFLFFYSKPVLVSRVPALQLLSLTNALLELQSIQKHCSTEIFYAV